MRRSQYALVAGLLLTSILVACSPAATPTPVPPPPTAAPALPTTAPAAAPATGETAVNWELVNPEGIVKQEKVEVNAHPASLEGKTIALRWNGKQNGDNFLNRLAELLTEQVKGVKLVKLYETDPWMNISLGPPYGSPDDAIKAAKKIKDEYKADLVIASQAD
ncbi:MAG TPA: hypothetical protein PLJ35_02390 [Anaerolineae bacterium]|nr:hypothetical protein [Anaerolineae bacterium]HOQ97652.1 hypothetical protein [Anaerolineae bacterium]HPL29670.1 hypothetical protein [Anaerolineae bacterium]